MEITPVQSEDGSWAVNYRVIDASRLKVNAKYTASLKVTPKGKAANVNPQTLNVTLTVKRYYLFANSFVRQSDVQQYKRRLIS